MGLEIERKFLLANDSWRTEILESKNIQQAYLKSDVNSSVRVRIYGEEGFINIKGAAKGNTRAEFEYAIPLQDAEALLLLCESGHIHKVRHQLVWEGHIWEID
jgi:adenylate cyclase